MACAPSAVSSPGWKTTINVPRHAVRAPASNLRGAGKPRHMHVMAAHMTDRHGLAFSVGNRRLTGIRQTRRFFDGQRIHIGAQHDCRAIAVAQQAYDARFTDAGRNLVACGTQTICGQTCRARLLHREFGMRVQILIKGLQVRKQAIEVAQN